MWLSRCASWSVASVSMMAIEVPQKAVARNDKGDLQTI
ncbi:hypothetical protein STXM2123_2207 [Streptomyces sp. F-3]|nr:hypothetical protein STXM2123_2207 [Streptomyces sp. F-3]